MSINGRRRLNFRFAALPIGILEDHDAGRLRDIDLVVVSKLIGRFRTWLIHETDEVLAALCGVSESAFKATMRRLRELGRVRSVKATVRGFRRALALVWLAPSEEEAQPLLASISEPNPATPEGPRLWPQNDPPLEPPLGRREREDNNHNGIAEVIAPAESQPSLSSFSLEGEEKKKADSAFVAEVVSEAQRLFPRMAEDLPAAVRAEAKKNAAAGFPGLRWVALALRDAQAGGARSWRFVSDRLERWRNQGYASPSAIVQPPQARGVSAPATPAPGFEPDPEGPPTADELEQARVWANGTDPSLRRLGERILASAVHTQS